MTGKTVLIVDENPAENTLLDNILNKSYEVIISKENDTALKFLQQNKSMVAVVIFSYALFYGMLPALRTVPVSYTHLDVYKRQHMRLIFSKGLQTILCLWTEEKSLSMGR